MDVISYGAANKVVQENKQLYEGQFGLGVKGSQDSVQKRISDLERSVGRITKKADELIIKDAVNIMKANRKLGLLHESSQKRMTNLFFEDFFDLADVSDLTPGTYEHDAVRGVLTIKPGASVMIKEDMQDRPLLGIVFYESAGPLKVTYMDDDGTERMIENETTFYPEAEHLHFLIQNESQDDVDLYYFGVAWS